MIDDLIFRLWDELVERREHRPLAGRKKPPVKPPPRKRKRPPVEEPNDEPERGDPKPKKKTPIGDPPAKRRRRQLSVQAYRSCKHIVPKRANCAWLLSLDCNS
jgi:hypothetical protein